MTESEAANIILSGIYVDDNETMKELNAMAYKALKFRIPVAPNILGEGRYSIRECADCKHILVDNFKFCPHCGQAVDNSRFIAPLDDIVEHD